MNPMLGLSRIFSALLLAFAVTLPVAAADRISTGADNGRWDMAANWLGGGLRRANDSLIFPQTARTPAVSNPLNVSFDRIFSEHGYSVSGSPILARWLQCAEDGDPCVCVPTAIS